MPDPSPISHAFDAARAESYDRQFEPVRTIKDTIHLVLRMHFAGLPADARILVVGAGTGAEVRFLAPLFPGWRFTLVDPSDAMLDVARRHADAEGFADRCAFHTGFVSSLSDEPHDAAASVLVSHFLTDTAGRQAFLADIAARLKPGGLLFDAALAGDREDPAFAENMSLWTAILGLTGMPPDNRARYDGMFGQDFAAHTPREVESLLAAAGFDRPVHCLQITHLHAWVATRR